MNVQVTDRSDAYTMCHTVIYLYFPFLKSKVLYEYIWVLTVICDAVIRPATSSPCIGCYVHHADRDIWYSH